MGRKKKRIEGCDIGGYDIDGGETRWITHETFPTIEEAVKEADKRNEAFEKEYGYFPDFQSYITVRPFIGDKYVDEDGEDLPEPDYEEEALYKNGKYLG